MTFVTNKYGGNQSHVAARFDLIPAAVLQKVAEILSVGAEKYGENNWQKITVEEHINHAIAHLYLYLKGDTSETHLLNAVCRSMFAAHMEHAPHPGQDRELASVGAVKKPDKTKCPPHDLDWNGDGIRFCRKCGVQFDAPFAGN